MNPPDPAKKIMASLHRNWMSVFIGLLFFIAISKLLALYMSNVDDGDWERFKTEHDCRLLVNESGNQRLSWQCNDGKIHYRWRQQR